MCKISGQSGAGFSKNVKDSLNIINIIKYVNVNNKTLFTYVISQNYYQVYNACYGIR